MKDPTAPKIPIINHPDVRRMLMFMKSVSEGLRALHYYVGFCEDMVRSAEDEEEKEKYQDFIDILIPVCKAYASDMGFRVCETAIQVYGGYGYCKEYPVEQFLRDCKIASIYEGTNGIQALDLVGIHLHTRLSAGGLVSCWHRLGEILTPWYGFIAQAVLHSAVLWADETGWRRNGRICWLWCFASKDACYYMIDRSRGSPALQKFFAEAFDGVLIADFWAAYNALCAGDKQRCLVHLLRELSAVDERNDSAEWKAFAKKLRRLLRDGIRLRKREGFSPERYGSRIRRMDQRLMALARSN